MATTTKRPEQTVAYRVYHNGLDLLGVATVELPELAYVTETLNGSGIAGEIENPTMGITSSIAATLTFTSIEDNVWNTIDWTQSALFECYSALQHTDDETGARTSLQYRINMLGRPKNFGLGSLEQGKKHGNTVELEVTRLETIHDGDQKLLYDKLNFIYKVNGTDLFASIREQMGMNV